MPWCVSDINLKKKEKKKAFIEFTHTLGVLRLDTIVITKLVGLFSLWIDIEKCACRWMQYRCRTHSACHTHGASVGIYMLAWVGLPLLVDKEKPHNSHQFSDDHSTCITSVSTVLSKKDLSRHFWSKNDIFWTMLKFVESSLALTCYRYRQISFFWMVV